MSPNRLRDSDPLPMIMQVLMQDDALAQHKENLFLIMSELFTNSLDHGVLRMDGSLKQTMEGMIQYLTEREKALAAIETGNIRMEIKHTTHGDERVFVVRVDDSGPGFDYMAKGACPSETCSMREGDSSLSVLYAKRLFSMAAGIRWKRLTSSHN